MLSARDLYHVSNQLSRFLIHLKNLLVDLIWYSLEILHNYLQQLVVKGYHFTHDKLELLQAV